MAEMGVYWRVLDDFRTVLVSREVALVASVGCGAMRNISWQLGMARFPWTWDLLTAAHGIVSLDSVEFLMA
jgi:hypothetical protein